jgi:hypothetical protein
MFSKKFLFRGVFVFLSFTAASLVSCSLYQKDDTHLQKKMRDAYQVSAKLFSYVWNPSLFMDPATEKEVSSLLLRMKDDFHKIDSSDGQDPGFVIALGAQNRLIEDIIQRFDEGNKEYAWWKLKGVTHNCVACHSRFSSRTDFIGVDVVASDVTFESKIAVAEFLIASRQFSKASKELYRLAESLSKLEGGSSYAVQVLRLWLLVQVRVQESYHGAASELARIKDSGDFSVEQDNLISKWIVDLQGVQSEKAFVIKDPLYEAEMLLGTLIEDRTFAQDDEDLVKTVRAGAILHQFSLGDIQKSKKPRLLMLLGVSYQRLTIPSLKALSPVYFEQCIREFPGTEESKIAYALYEKDFELLHTGSGGSHVSEDEVSLLEELRQIAFDLKKE